MLLRQLIILGVCFSFLVGTGNFAYGGIKDDRTREIKAAFLLQFSKYVKWPENSFSGQDAPVIVGIFGRDPFGSVLDELASTFRANGRSVDIRRFNAIASIGRSHILFISEFKISRMAEISSTLSGRPVLLVTDAPGFPGQEGIINFIMIGNKVRFNISLTNSRKAGLEISSKLLKVAHKVE